MLRHLGTAAAAGLILLAGAPAATADGEPVDTMTPELQQTSAYVMPSLVYVGVQFEGYVFDPLNNQYLNDAQPFSFGGRCTGYVVNPDGYIATAGHCVDNLGRGGTLVESLTYAGAQWAYESGYYGDVYSSPEEILAAETYEVHGFETGDVDPDLVSVEVAWPEDATGGAAGETAVAEVVEWHSIEEDDTALLKVNLDGLMPLPLSDEDITVGEEVVAVGYPGSVDQVTTPDLSASYKEGAISSIKTNIAGTGDVYEMSAAISGGMSGGPTVNLDGEVVGHNSYSPTGESQAFNFIGPSEATLTLMQQNGVENELGTLGEQYRAGLDALFAGDREASIAAFEAVLDEDPGNPYATQYLAQAQDLEAAPAASESDSGGFPVLWVAIGAAGLVVLGLVLFLLLRRSGNPAVPASAPGGPAVPGAMAWPPPQQPQQQPMPVPQPAYQQPPPPPPPPPAAGFDPNKTTYVGRPDEPR